MSEQQSVLDLLANGKITAEEAAEMLNALKTKAPVVDEIEDLKAAEKTAVDPTVVIKEIKSVEKSGKSPSWLHIRVRDMETGKNKVTVNIPMGIVKFGLNVGRRFSPELQGIDIDELNSAVSQADEGVIVEVKDEESNEHVLIYTD